MSSTAIRGMNAYQFLDPLSGTWQHLPEATNQYEAEAELRSLLRIGEIGHANSTFQAQLRELSPENDETHHWKITIDLC